MRHSLLYISTCFVNLSLLSESHAAGWSSRECATVCTSETCEAFPGFSDVCSKNCPRSKPDCSPDKRVHEAVSDVSNGVQDLSQKIDDLKEHIENVEERVANSQEQGEKVEEEVKEVHAKVEELARHTTGESSKFSSHQKGMKQARHDDGDEGEVFDDEEEHRQIYDIDEDDEARIERPHLKRKRTHDDEDAPLLKRRRTHDDEDAPLLKRKRTPNIDVDDEDEDEDEVKHTEHKSLADQLKSQKSKLKSHGDQYSTEVEKLKRKAKVDEEEDDEDEPEHGKGKSSMKQKFLGAGMTGLGIGAAALKGMSKLTHHEAKKSEEDHEGVHSETKKPSPVKKALNAGKSLFGKIIHKKEHPEDQEEHHESSKATSEEKKEEAKKKSPVRKVFSTGGKVLKGLFGHH